MSLLRFLAPAKTRKSDRIDLSVVVVAYNIPRELQRTLTSLASSYQRHIDRNDYEVIVVDNGSQPMVSEDTLRTFDGNMRLITMRAAPASPAAAINRGLSEARGEIIGVMIDGARLATPGLLHFARHAARLYPSGIVAALGWYLGADLQRFGMQAGYDKCAEDSMLKSIDWPSDGYRLFEVGTLDESSLNGWLAPVSESNGLFLSRETWSRLNGVDERFDRPGGALLNLDTFRRALELPDSELVLLLGEGTFHQLHGGVSTNVPDLSNRWTEWERQYREIRGHPYAVPLPDRVPTYIGTLPQPALKHFVRAALHPLPHHPAPLGATFDQTLWSEMPTSPASDPKTAALIELAHSECRAGHYPIAAAIARLARSNAPREPEPQRLVTFFGSSLSTNAAPHDLSADYHAALGDAQRILGDVDAAANHYKAALGTKRDLVRAHVGLAQLRLSGDFYYEWIRWFYESLEPTTIVEIGVFEGRSLAMAKPPTLAIGVDPTPKLIVSPQTNVQLYTETSDVFFERKRLDGVLKGEPLSVGFIDGLHLFEQSLKDFINLERYCGPKSILLFHDTLPLDEATQSRACDTQFHTGDVWKAVLCLKHYRPELDIFTIATPWTGLTVVTGLDPASVVLSGCFEEAVASFMDMPFAAVADSLETKLNVVANDRSVVEARLKARGVI